MTNKWETTINIWATTTNYKQRQTKNNDKRKHTKKADHLDTRTTWTTLTNWATLTLTNQWLIKKIIAEFALFTWSCFISIVLFCHSFIILLSTLATLCTAGIRFWQFLSATKSTFQFFQWSWQFQMLSVLWKQSMSTQGTTGNHSNIRCNISCHEWVIIRSVLNKTIGEWTPLHHFQVQLIIRWDEFTIFSQSLELRILGLQPTTCSPSTCGSTVCSWSWCLALSWLLSLGSWY